MSDDRSAGKEGREIEWALLRSVCGLSAFHTFTAARTLSLTLSPFSVVVINFCKRGKAKAAKDLLYAHTRSLLGSSASPKLFLPPTSSSSRSPSVTDSRSSFPTPMSDPSPIARLGKLGCLRQVNIPTRESARERVSCRRISCCPAVADSPRQSTRSVGAGGATRPAELRPVR